MRPMRDMAESAQLFEVVYFPEVSSPRKKQPSHALPVPKPADKPSFLEEHAKGIVGGVSGAIVLLIVGATAAILGGYVDGWVDGRIDVKLRPINEKLDKIQ